ncbi:MAG: hypothetical protein AB7F50_03775 [Fimbriimonadaceae bacterium]
MRASDCTMKTRQASATKRGGQTLVIAIILLGVLAILGFAFASIIARNISQAERGRDRSIATELARAGAEYVHYQLRHATLGADWRPEPTPPQIDAMGFTKDPDALYLRPGSPFGLPSDTATPILGQDLGGPDGLGPYTRVSFERGRALVRVRYAPSDFDAFANPTGNMRQGGKARSMLVIETVGRPGNLNPSDPTQLLAERVRVTGFANYAQKQTELGGGLGRLKQLNNLIVNSRVLIAFASIGIIESGRYITNKFKVSAPAELGFLNSRATGSVFDTAGSGTSYTDGQAPFAAGPDGALPVTGVQAWGRVFAEPNGGLTNGWSTSPGGGSLWSNADLKVFGQHDVSLNTYLGESWMVVGSVLSANRESMVRVSRNYYDRTADQWRSDWAQRARASTVNNPLVLSDDLALGTRDYPLASDNGAFSTVGGVYRDGGPQPDDLGYSRGVPRKEPPSILDTDPQSGLNRYQVLTRDSGAVVNFTNIGRFGYGRGVYCDSAERANAFNEDEREAAGAVRSLVNDWLNPNNAGSTGWRGPYYIPLASYMRLGQDGFTIIRDTRSRSKFWRTPTGGNTNNTSIRYRLRRVEFPLGSGIFEVMSLNSVEHPNLVARPGAALTDGDFQNNGRLFNGVVMFEGDVRVRGVIPTDLQLSVVSLGSVYVEGSVTKGVVTESGAVLQRPSASSLMLMAKDYVVVNPTMLFGPEPGTKVEEKDDDPIPDTPNPMELSVETPEAVLSADFLLDPDGVGSNPADPSSWQPFAHRYAAFGTGSSLPSNLLLRAAADDNGPTFVSADVVPSTYLAGGSPSSLLFPRVVTVGASVVQFNAASQYFAANPTIPVYGLGDPGRNSYPKFETIEMPLVTSVFTYGGRQLSDLGGLLGDVVYAAQDRTQVRVRLNSVGGVPLKNFLAARTAIAPFDVRIEAAMFAEEGSFFVIPGHWFNNNVQDTRRRWLDRTPSSPYAGMNDDEARLRRYQIFGVTPAVPFYGEPLDVRISILGSVSENMPAPASAQAEWLRKWGWIPRALGCTGERIPVQHAGGLDLNLVGTVSNLNIVYDPMLATATYDGTNPVRIDAAGRTLPPMPRLPVSPTLAYFGEVNP